MIIYQTSNTVFLHFCPVTVTVPLPSRYHHVTVMLPSRNRLEVNVHHRSSAFLNVPQRDIPLPTVPQRDIPLLTVTHRYPPLLTVTHRYFNVTPTKLYGLLNEKIFVVCLA